MSHDSPEQRLTSLGFILPPPLPLPSGLRLPFQSIRIVGDVAYVSGHGPQGADGSMSGPFGRVGAEVSIEEGYVAARNTGLSILADLRRTLGSLDRITAWGSVFGMVNCTPDFSRQPEVINGFSDLILEVFGPEVGAHARSAIGVIALPFGGIPVEIEARVHITPTSSVS